jgi:hypothetical protein
MPGLSRNRNRFIALGPAAAAKPSGNSRIWRAERSDMDKKTGLVSQGVTEKPGDFRISTVVGLWRTSAEACTCNQGRNQARADKEQTTPARKIQKGLNRNQ